MDSAIRTQPQNGEKAVEDGETDVPSVEVSPPAGEVVLPVSLTMKHPLKHKWALWHLSADRNKSWENRLNEICAFDTVEDFWALYNNIRPPSALQWSCDYNVFREGIRPMWEEEQNKRGGRWLISIDKVRHNDLLDIFWLEVLLAIIGEQFGEQGEEICGAVANIRNKGDKISIWTRDAGNSSANMKIGEILKKKLLSADMPAHIPQPPFDVLRYENHDEVQNKSGSTVKARLTV